MGHFIFIDEDTRLAKSIQHHATVLNALDAASPGARSTIVEYATKLREAMAEYDRGIPARLQRAFSAVAHNLMAGSILHPGPMGAGFVHADAEKMVEELHRQNNEEKSRIAQARADDCLRYAIVAVIGARQISLADAKLSVADNAMLTAISKKSLQLFSKPHFSKLVP